jgi:peroxiredoxin
MIQLGEIAPDFTLKNTDGQDVTLSARRGESSVVLLFFPLAFTGVCTTELCQMRDNMKIYDSLNATVLAVSVDSFFTLKEFKKMQNLNFDLLSDFNKTVSASYGALYESFFGMSGVAKRSAFVIDRDGIVRYAEVLEDAGKLPDFQAIQSMLGSI